MHMWHANLQSSFPANIFCERQKWRQKKTEEMTVLLCVNSNRSENAPLFIGKYTKPCAIEIIAYFHSSMKIVQMIGGL